MKYGKFLLFLRRRYVSQIQRSASNYQRLQLKSKTADYLNALKSNYFQNRTELTMVEWQSVRDYLITNNKYINTSNVDSMIMGACTEPKNLSLAKSYVDFLTKSGIQPNDATLSKLLRVYNIVYHSRGGDVHSLPESEQEEILYICDILKQKHELLDSALCENLICGLVATSRWRDGLELLNMMKLTNGLTVVAYSELVIKSFAVLDTTLGWSILTDMLQHQRTPKFDVFINILQAILKNMDTYREEFEKFLKFLEQYEIIVTKEVAQCIEDVANKYPKLLSVTNTTLKPSGICNNCAEQMQGVTLSKEDFQKLQEAFLKKTLIGKDVFQKSSPNEVERFKNYVNQTKPYNCVIDGLNVAYSMGNKKPVHSLANLLCDVVQYFVNRDKRVLVLGREHMKKWPKKIMQYIHNNAFIFLTKDLSQDDPFLLYAALTSGQDTDFCSRDFMRQHAHLLGPELKFLFRRWQQEHQYSLITKTKHGKILVKQPVRYLLSTQKVNDMWHLPYKDDYSLNSTDCFEIHQHWLCVKIKN